MNTLESLAAHWRQSMEQNTSLDTTEIDELECHLLDASDRLVATGLTSSEAFIVCARRLGTPIQLDRSYRSRNTLWERLFRPSVLGSLVVLVVLVVIVAAAYVGGSFMTSLVPENAAILFAEPGTQLRMAKDGVYVSGGNGGMISIIGLKSLVALFSMTVFLGVAGWGALLKRQLAS